MPALPSRERVTDFMDLILARISEVKSDTEKIQSDTTKILAILESRTPPPSTQAHPHNLPPWMSPAYFIGREDRAPWTYAKMRRSRATAGRSRRGRLAKRGLHQVVWVFT